MAGKTAATDLETRQAIYEGVSIAQLCKIFGMQNQTVSKRIAALKPSGERSGHPIYALKEAARYLVEPVYDAEQVIRRMNHRDLPPMLLKEYWTGQLAKQRFEEESGHLWRTEAVIHHCGEAFKTIRMSLLLLGDSVERETSLTERQREIIRRLVDSTLNGASNALIGQFGEQEDASGSPEEVEDEAL